MIVLKLVLLLLALAALIALVIRLGWPLPPLGERVRSQTITDTADTALGRATAEPVAAHPDLSAIHALADGIDAFAARAAIIRAAERSIDLQYYIWANDLTGIMLAQELRDAAARGVRVRILVDDNGVAGMDPLLAALDSHPRIEVRLFNPFVLRWPKPLGYLAEPLRLNHRMHNKSLTADNRVTVIGGRNLGDVYFAAGGEAAFVDLDVAAFGPIVGDVSNQFQTYWDAELAYPSGRILPPPPAPLDEVLAQYAAPHTGSAQSAAYHQALAQNRLVADMDGDRLMLDWAPVRLVADDPRKAQGLAPDSDLLLARLSQTMAPAQARFTLVSGYFVPTAAGTAELARMARSGVQVTVLTNAFESTDVPLVHSGYAKWRRDLLDAGVELYELRADAAPPSMRQRGPARGSGSGSGGKASPDRPGFRLQGSGSGSGSGSGGGSSGGPIASSRSALHAKSFAVDGQQLFVGSFNFDPRSARLNTELGFVIDSPAAAARFEQRLGENLPAMAYRVRIDQGGALVWDQRDGAQTITHHTEPGTTATSRALVTVFGWLPIDWLL